METYRRCPIVQKDLKGNVIAVYDSILQAKMKTGMNSSIDAILSGRQKSSKGFVFEYLNPDDKVVYKKATLCLDCNTPSFACPWKFKYKPVDGWDAIPHKMSLSNKKTVTTYIVKSCPLFERDVREKPNNWI
jgi:hypothetical protein